MIHPLSHHPPFFCAEDIMLKRVFFGVVSIFALSAVSVYADSKDDLKAAVQKVADSPNYSWSTTVTGGMGRGPQEGKTEKDGYTTLTIQFRENSFEIALKGDKSAVKTDSGWKSGAELMAAAGDDAGGPPPPERFAAMFAQNFKTPIAQAQENLDGLQNIQKTGDSYAADLSPEAAKKLLTFRPRRAAATTNSDNGAPPPPQIEVSDAKGSAKFTVKDGAVTALEVHVTGTVSFNGGEGRDVDRTISTEIKSVGSTTVDVPDEAKAKLGS